ncbi:hypothetical protein GCM10009601_39940 [Streptomyces thermospinosisporus]|uniref:MarR family transcriptional regulator n=1 Tax=Streptomyces thermospinosisporus TaxID=161482 RepID=A0ABP4JSY2_9ACTN
MSGIRDFLDRDGYRRLSRALADAAAAHTTGEIQVSGRPGGSFHLRDGLVVAVESPGAPGPEALLLRSGRVTGEQWAELMREPGAGKWPAAGLIAHGYAGAVQLRVVRMMAMQDAVFAILAGRIEECARPAEGHPLAPLEQGEPPARLLHEATRKLAALAALPHSVRPDGERPVPTGLAERAWPHLPHSQRELLTHADGRRTARDIAFRTGRSVYTVTAEISRMLQEGHLTCPGPEASPVLIRTEGDPAAALRRRRPPGKPSSSPGRQGQESSTPSDNASRRTVTSQAAAPGRSVQQQPPPAGRSVALPDVAPRQPAAQVVTPERPVSRQAGLDRPALQAVAPAASVSQESDAGRSPSQEVALKAPTAPVPAPGKPAALEPVPALTAPQEAARDHPASPELFPGRPVLSPSVLSALASLPAAEERRAEGDAAGDISRAGDISSAGDTSQGRHPEPGAAARAAPALAALPRRRRGASGRSRTLDPGRSGASWKGFFRLRGRG